MSALKFRVITRIIGPCWGYVGTLSPSQFQIACEALTTPLPDPIIEGPIYRTGEVLIYLDGEELHGRKIERWPVLWEQFTSIATAHARAEQVIIAHRSEVARELLQTGPLAEGSLV